MKIALIHDPDLNKSRGYEAFGVFSYHNLCIASITNALNHLGHNVEICETNSDLEIQLKIIKPELVFNTSIKRFNGSAHAFAPEILEKLEIPFTGPSAIACSDAYDKKKSIEILDNAGIHTPQAVTFSPGEIIELPNTLVFPLFVKPQRGGCSQGIGSQSLISNIDKAAEKIKAVLEDIGKSVIVEEFLSGREFTVGILGNQPPRILSILEFIFHDSELPFRSFSRKMVNFEIEDEVCLADLEADDKLSIENLAIRAFKALKCKDYARVDVRMDTLGNPAVLEVNAIPNLEPETSSFGLMAKYAGFSFVEIVESIINSALKRYSQADCM